MFKKTKIALMSLLCAGCVVSAGVGAASVSVQASASEVFAVESGAAVRLKNEDEQFGIRFSATVGEVVEGAKYNILILPTQLVDMYNEDASENKANIVTYMKDLAEKNDGSLSIVENCKVNADGKIYGSIVDVLWNNINRDFVAVAYYEKGGSIVVADMAADGARSVVDVSENALATGKYNGADETSVQNKTALVDKIRKGEKQGKGYASDQTYIYEDFRYASETTAYGHVTMGTHATNTTAEVIGTFSEMRVEI